MLYRVGSWIGVIFPVVTLGHFRLLSLSGKVRVVEPLIPPTQVTAGFVTLEG